jgi:carbonic anhydrase
MMNFIETICKRNSAYVQSGRSSDLKIIPSTKTVIIGCLDPRADPMEILGLKLGDAAIYRNIGGRINPAFVETMILLPIVTKAVGQDMGPGWNFVVLHHTDCGIKGCYKFAPDLLASHLGVTRAELESMAVTDPHKAVAMDVDAYRANKDISGGYMISGLVYDVSTRKIDVVVSPSRLRSED